MKLCVVIPAYNHLAEVMTAINSLRALAASPSDVAFHVQDDSSPDVNFVACIPSEIASVQRNERNLGFGANCNAAAKVAAALYQPEFLFFVNQDVYGVPEWSAGWDTALLDGFAGEQVGLVAPRLLFPNGAVQSVGGIFDALSQPVHRCLGWRDPHACDEAGDVQWATGAALAVQATLFEHLGGFDERYERGYFEDVDLCLRAREVQARIHYTPGCTLMHSVGSTGGSPYFRQNALRFKAQWVDSGKVQAGRHQPTQRFW